MICPFYCLCFTKLSFQTFLVDTCLVPETNFSTGSNIADSQLAGGILIIFPPTMLLILYRLNATKAGLNFLTDTISFLNIDENLKGEVVNEGVI